MMTTLPKSRFCKDPDVIIFDCYKTIAYNEVSTWIKTFDNIARTLSLKTEPKIFYDRWKKLEREFRVRRTDLENPGHPIFKTYRQAWEECFDVVFKESSWSADVVLASQLCVEHMARQPIFPEVRPALERLVKRKRLGLFSNADNDFVMPLLKREKLPFESVASSESARSYKPHTKAFQHILDVMEVEAENAWYVGDHLYDDVMGANIANITPVWINREGKSSSGANCIEIKSLDSLNDLLD